MPKSSNESSRQMLEYIKKVAAAGRGGDTKLAYLSSSARQLLKDLGGAGTKNSKTKLPEYRRRRFLEEGEFMEPSAGAPPAAPAFQPPPVMPEPPAAMTPIASEPPQAPPMDPRDFRLAQEPRPMFSGMLPRNARQEFDEIAAPAQSVDSQREAELRRQAEEAQRAEEMRAAQQAEEIRRSEARRQLDEVQAAENLARYSTQQQQVPALVAQAAPVSVAPTPEPAVGSSAADLEELGRSLSASGMTAPPGLEEMLSTLTPGSLSSARESILPPAPQEPMPEPSETRASVRAGEDLSVTAAQRDAEVRRAADAQRRVEEGELARRRDEELRRAAEEEAARRQAEEAAARRAQEEAARRAQEEAARVAQEEAAARVAQEEAARAAQEAAARKAAQDAAAARQAEEARRMAQEAAARKAAEDAARVQPPIAPPAQPPVAPPPPPAPPPGLVESPIQKQPAPPQTGQPPGTGIFFPQPPSSPPPPPPTPPAPPGSQDPNMRTHQFIDKNLNGIDDRDESPASVSPKPPRLRTTDMQDSNNNGIDDRDEPGGADYDPNNPKKPPSRGDSPIMQPPVFGDGIRIPEVPKDKAAPAPPVKRTPQVSIPGRFLDENTDIGRLLKRVGGGRSVSRGPSTKGDLKRGAPKPPVDEIPGADRPRPVRPEPPMGLFPEPPGGDQPTIPVQPPPNIPVRGPESQIPVRPLPGPLPTPIGAGTPTPYFNPNAGGLTPGTVPVSQMPESLKTSQVPLDAIARNPNLSPTILGGQENLGYYRDRLGNLIMAPGAVRPPGFAFGGEVTDEEEDYGEQDAASARAMLDRLSSEAPEFRAIPTKRRARRQEAERGSAKGMAMELEQMSKPQGPRTKRQAEELRQKMELLRDTLGMPTLTRAGLAREGELLAQRFAEGGEAEKEKLVLPPDRSKGFREEGMEFNPKAIPAAQVRIYLNTLFGQTRPITERDFTPEELGLALEAMKKAKESGRESTVDYRDYGIPLTPFADLHPFEGASIRNTLGTWNYETKDDTLRGKDRYDFDRDLGGRSSAEYAKMSLPKKLGVLALDTVNLLPLFKDMYNVVRLKPMTGEGMAYGPFTLPHRIGAAFMPPEGREVDINFGSQAAKELEAVAPKKKKKRFAEGGEAKRAKESKPTGEFGMFGGLKQMLLESDAFKSMTPLQVRTYLQSVEGLPEMRTMPITEKDLDQEELDKLRDVIEFQKRLVKDPANYKVGPGGKKVYNFAEPNTVNYDVHELYRKAKQGISVGSASQGLDPNVRDKSGGLPWYEGDRSVLPSANLRNTLGQFRFEELPDGTTVVRDKFDFTKDVALDSNALVRYAEELGVNRPVNIVLPPKKKGK